MVDAWSLLSPIFIGNERNDMAGSWLTTMVMLTSQIEVLERSNDFVRAYVLREMRIFICKDTFEHRNQIEPNYPMEMLNKHTKASGLQYLSFNLKKIFLIMLPRNRNAKCGHLNGAR